MIYMHACSAYICWILFIVSFITHSKALTVSCMRGLGDHVVDSTSGMFLFIRLFLVCSHLIYKLTPIKNVWEATVLGAMNFSFFLRGSQYIWKKSIEICSSFLLESAVEPTET